MTKDATTTVLGALTGVSMFIAANGLQVPETPQGWVALLAGLSLAALGHQTNKK